MYDGTVRRYQGRISALEHLYTNIPFRDRWKSIHYQAKVRDSIIKKAR
jgi:hypothetical protein